MAKYMTEKWPKGVGRDTHGYRCYSPPRGGRGIRKLRTLVTLPQLSGNKEREIRTSGRLSLPHRMVPPTHGRFFSYCSNLPRSTFIAHPDVCSWWLSIQPSLQWGPPHRPTSYCFISTTIAPHSPLFWMGNRSQTREVYSRHQKRKVREGLGTSELWILIYLCLLSLTLKTLKCWAKGFRGRVLAYRAGSPGFDFQYHK